MSIINSNIDVHNHREDLSKLNYTTMCIKETLRLYPLTAHIGKLSSEDVVVNEYRIPKGIILRDNLSDQVSCS